jgi:outer membrane receptor protein involved in Fe transport
VNTKSIVFAVAVLWSLGSSLTQAQTTGSTSGTVTDETGAFLPGVAVELSGPALQGVRRVTTDAQGRFRFVNVPAGGNYSVGASLPGFQPTTKEGLHFYLGQDGTVNLRVKAAISEALTVVGEAPLVDVTKTTTGVNITASQFESLPTARSFQQLTTLAPGVTMEMGDHDDQFANSPSVGSSSAPENNYVIDGLSATDPRYGTSGTNLTMNFVQEVQVMTGGYGAEYGRSTGGVFNVVTKSGGNRFDGDVFAYYRNRGWSPDNVVRRANKQTTTLFNGDTNADFGGSLGGPIVKDKLWFFAAVDPTRRTTYIGGVVDSEGVAAPSTGQKFDADSNIYATKLTWALAPNHSLVATGFGDPTTQDGWLGAANSDPGPALQTARKGSHNLGLRYSGILSPRFLIEASLGRHQQRKELLPASDTGRTVPRQIDETLGEFEHGGFQLVQKDSSTRDAFALKLTNYLGNHELRYGADVEVNRYDANFHELWYLYFGVSDARGGTYIQPRDYSVQGKGTTTNSAFFAQDQWKITSNLTLNLGLRYEEQRLGSARDVAVGESYAEAEACNGDVTACRTVPNLKLKGNWAPRIGLVWDPARNGRSKVYGFYGKFYEAMPLDLNVRAINGETYDIKQMVNPNPSIDSRNWFNPSGSPLAINGTWEEFSHLSLTALTPLDESLKAQYQNEFIVGGEYQFTPVWSASVRLVDRELKRVVEDFGIFTDPSDPLALTGYVIGNPGEGNFGAPFPKPERYYRAVELTLQRAQSNHWQLFSSFVYAKAKGNYEGLYLSGYDQLDPNLTAAYDIPSFLNNGLGPLRSDKPFQFKVHSAYSFPFGLTISEGFFLSAGIPISAQGPEIVNGYGDGTIWLKTRGTEGRTPTYWSLDLHADYRLPVFKKGSRKGLSVIVDAFNVLNRHQVLEVDQDYIFEGMAGIDAWEDPANLDTFGNPKFNASLPASPYYKTPTLYQSPRSVQLGVKLTF